MAQVGAAAQAVKARARARGRVRLWTLVTTAMARNGRDPRLVHGVRASGTGGNGGLVMQGTGCGSDGVGRGKGSQGYRRGWERK